MAHPTAIANNALIVASFDSTNGTVSEGDVIRLGSSHWRDSPAAAA